MEIETRIYQGVMGASVSCRPCMRFSSVSFQSQAESSRLPAYEEEVGHVIRP
jgi:hypothetical protein